MDAEHVKQLIEDHISGAQVHVKVDGNSYHVTVVSDAFEGLSPVKKQQLVYACINPHITSGDIHAVTMETLTAAEWQKVKAFR